MELAHGPFHVGDISRGMTFDSKVNLAIEDVIVISRPQKRGLLRRFNHAVKKMDFLYRLSFIRILNCRKRSVYYICPTLRFESYSEEKIHLFYRKVKVQFSGALLTDY